MKLLAKNAEDRYQSAQGIISDLELCIKKRDDENFIPGKFEVKDRFLIPEKLYNRGKESENRAGQVFKSFFSAISCKAFPLVIFLDDLQWIDLSSIQLIKLLMESLANDNIFFICSFRDNEVAGTHPLMKMIKDLKDNDNNISFLHLSNLLEKDVLNLLSESLDMDKKDINSLGSIVFEKTGGNAFYTKTLLKSVYQEGILFYSREKRIWAWDLDKISGMEYIKNVVELLCESIKKLPDQTKQVLSVAACIGH